MANFHWSVSFLQIREDSTPRAAWLILGRRAAGLSGSFPLERWNWMGLLGADWPTAYHDYTFLLSLLFLSLFSLFYNTDSFSSWEEENYGPVCYYCFYHS